jgi:hypothetical protein
LSLHGIASLSLPNYGRAGLDPVQGLVRAPTKPCELGVHDGIGAHDLPHARGPHIPCASAGIHGGMHDILRERVWCAITPISSLSAIVLWPGTTPPDPLGDLTHRGLCDPVRGLHGDCG